jgi:hypothetical protein
LAWIIAMVLYCLIIWLPCYLKTFLFEFVPYKGTTESCES